MSKNKIIKFFLLVTLSVFLIGIILVGLVQDSGFITRIGKNKKIQKVQATNNMIEVDEKIQLASIDGVKIAEGDDSAQEFTELQATVEQLKQKVTSLETSKTEMQQKVSKLETDNAEMQQQIENNQNEYDSKLDSVEIQIDNILANEDVSTRQVLFEGTAGTKGTTYTMSDISSYKYLVVYADVLSGSIRTVRTSRIIKVSDIVYNNTSTATANSVWLISEIASNSYHCGVSFYFKTTNSFFISNLFNAGWTSPRIYKIEGLK